MRVPPGGSKIWRIMNQYSASSLAQSQPEQDTLVQAAQLDDYEAPAIEAVVTLEDLERETHYAGISLTNVA